MFVYETVDYNWACVYDSANIFKILHELEINGAIDLYYFPYIK